jgi:hypothetical protein
MPRGMPRISMTSWNGERKTGRVPQGLHISEFHCFTRNQYGFIPDLRQPAYSLFSPGSLSQKIINIMTPLG